MILAKYVSAFSEDLDHFANYFFDRMGCRNGSAALLVVTGRCNIYTWRKKLTFVVRLLTLYQVLEMEGVGYRYGIYHLCGHQIYERVCGICEFSSRQLRVVII